MRVLKINFEPISGCLNFVKAKAEVVEKPFSWVIKHQPMAICQDVDPGSIESDEIPEPIFENWGEYGHSGGKSDIIPQHVDLNAHAAAHSSLRLYGTIDIVETIYRDEYQIGPTGLKAFLQFLLKTSYITSGCTFENDLLPAAKKQLTVWDKPTTYAFVSRVLGKPASNVSVADVAYVVGSLTGKTIDVTKENFSLLSTMALLSVEEAAKRRPDEFFTAAFVSEVMELDILKSLLVAADDGYYFGKGSKYPKNWGFVGPDNVLWRMDIHRGKSDTVMVEFGPMAGTMFDRALASKKTLFPECDGEIPFSLPIEKCHIFDSTQYKISPRQFNTGLRYLSSTDNAAQLYKVQLQPTDISELDKDLNRFNGCTLIANPSLEEISKEIVRLYGQLEPAISRTIDKRHYIVFPDLARLAEDAKRVEDCKALENEAERLDMFVLSGKPATVRAILTYVWVLKHMMTESLCYEAADNDDFTVESAVEYCLDICVVKHKPFAMYLLNASYSNALGTKKKVTKDVVGITNGINFDIS